MYQEWVSPSFTVDQLTRLCLEFFNSEKIPTLVEKNSKGETVVRAHIGAINEEVRIVIEMEKSKLRLSYPVPGRPTGTSVRLLGIFLSGEFIKSGTEKQLFLDRLEQQFWENLDRKLSDQEASTNTSAQDH